MSTRLAEQIADAVLYEGYVLYPYRASAAKNRFRWQVGLVMPRGYAEATGSDPWFMQTECLAETARGASLTVRVRCLHVQERLIEQAVDSGERTWQPVDSLVVDGRQLVTWEEAIVCEFVGGALPIARTMNDEPREWSFAWNLDASESVETVRADSGRVAARIVRRRRSVATTIRIETEPCGHFLKIRVRIENVSPCPASSGSGREAAVRQSLAGTHTILSADNGLFLSLLEPPPSASAAAASCRNLHTWPVLVGAAGSRSVMLSSPIILYDYPTVAPESPGDLCDATEIDELLMLRVKTLTPDEKREARATDDRAARIIERADALSADTMSRLHGAIRHFADAPLPDKLRAHPDGDGGNLREDRVSEEWDTFLNPPDEAPPEAATLEIGVTRVGSGSRVRLKPAHRADSMDMCLDGRTATVTAVHRTLEDKAYVTVILDDDPFGAAGTRYRRALFFHPDEIVPLDRDTRGGPGSEP